MLNSLIVSVQLPIDLSPMFGDMTSIPTSLAGIVAVQPVSVAVLRRGVTVGPVDGGRALSYGRTVRGRHDYR
jgi:hypothetical protein